MPLSSEARREAVKPQGTSAWIEVLTIAHPDLTAPEGTIRVANNSVDIVSRGETFYAYPFRAVFPTALKGEASRASIEIDNVGTVRLDSGQEFNLVHELRRVRGKPTIILEVVLSRDLDIVEVGPLKLRMKRAPWDALTIRAELSYLDTLNQQFGRVSYTPYYFPGLFPR
jgi:hypothetical protein